MKHTLALLRSAFVATLLVAPIALANEPAAQTLASTEPTGSVPLVLGAPPAWTVLALGVLVVSVTVLRRVLKTAPARARR